MSPSDLAPRLPARPVTPSRPADRGPSRRARWLELWPDLLSFVGALMASVAAALLVGLLGALGGCGGGSGVGTEGTGSYSAGPITGFGSIVVNGVHFEEASAQVVDADDGSSTPSALALGMVVEVIAGPVAADASGTPRATATAVRSVRALRGPLDAAPDAAGRFTVLGQAVQLQADTVYGNGLTSAATLQAGQVLEVYGSFDSASLVWRASRVALAATADSSGWCVRGTVTAVGGGSFVLNGRSYSLAQLPDASAVSVGAHLKLALRGPGGPGAEVRVAEARTQPEAPDQSEARIEGLLAAISGSRWRVDGSWVEVSAARISGTPAVGLRAEVSGSWRQGVLVADAVELSSGSGQRSFEVEGRVASVDLARQVFTVRSLDGRRSTLVSLAGSGIVWRDGAAAEALAGFAGTVRVRGLIAEGGGLLLATEVRFERSRS